MQLNSLIVIQRLAIWMNVLNFLFFGLSLTWALILIFILKMLIFITTTGIWSKFVVVDCLHVSLFVLIHMLSKYINRIIINTFASKFHFVSFVKNSLKNYFILFSIYKFKKQTIFFSRVPKLKTEFNGAQTIGRSEISIDQND